MKSMVRRMKLMIWFFALLTVGGLGMLAVHLLAAWNDGPGAHAPIGDEYHTTEEDTG
jgi:hypothetical protein